MVDPLRRLPAFTAATAAGVGLAALLWGLLAWNQLRSATVADQWIEDLYAIKQAAAERSDPTLLLIGGSGVHFGMNAHLLQQTIDLPVVNFGNHAGLGLPYLLERAGRALRPGDVAVLILEYPQYRTVAPSDLLYSYLATFDAERFADLPWPQRLEAILSVDLVEAVRTALGSKAAPKSYTGQNVTPDGDETGNLAERRDLRRIEYLARTAHTSIAIAQPAQELIRRFVERCRRDRIVVIAGWPAILDHPDLHSAAARAAQDEIARFYGVLGVPMVGAPDEWYAPASAMFDTEYHLTHRAGLERTARFAVGLRAALDRADQLAHGLPASGARVRPTGLPSPGAARGRPGGRRSAAAAGGPRRALARCRPEVRSTDDEQMSAARLTRRCRRSGAHGRGVGRRDRRSGDRLGQP